MNLFDKIDAIISAREATLDAEIALSAPTTLAVRQARMEKIDGVISTINTHLEALSSSTVGVKVSSSMDTISNSMHSLHSKVEEMYLNSSMSQDMRLRVKELTLKLEGMKDVLSARIMVLIAKIKAMVSGSTSTALVVVA